MGLRRELAEVRLNRAASAEAQGDFDQALRLLEEAENSGRELPHQRLLVRALREQARIYAEQTPFETLAREKREEADRITGAAGS
jgi:hypothetical protein